MGIGIFKSHSSMNVWWVITTIYVLEWVQTTLVIFRMWFVSQVIRFQNQHQSWIQLHFFSWIHNHLQNRNQSQNTWFQGRETFMMSNSFRVFSIIFIQPLAGGNDYCMDYISPLRSIDQLPSNSSCWLLVCVTSITQEYREVVNQDWKAFRWMHAIDDTSTNHIIIKLF